LIALVDYGAGNLRSVENALGRLGVSASIASEADGLSGASAIIFPGVGAAGPAMARLKQHGLDEALRSSIRGGVPFLGICLGMQLLFDWSAEDGTACLSVLRGTVERMQTTEKLPHVGWNTIEGVRPHPVLDGLQGEAFYFVHSYVVVPRHPAVIASQTVHGSVFVSAVAHQNLVAVQFHPERSGDTGMKLIENFLAFAGVESNAVQADHSVS
jgi:glutamine amidotransferase